MKEDKVNTKAKRIEQIQTTRASKKPESKPLLLIHLFPSPDLFDLPGPLHNLGVVIGIGIFELDSPFLGLGLCRGSMGIVD